MLYYHATITRTTGDPNIGKKESYVIVTPCEDLQGATITLMRDVSAADDIIAVEVRALTSPGTFKV